MLKEEIYTYVSLLGEKRKVDAPSSGSKVLSIRILEVTSALKT
jgi:hypothetical protein